MTIVLLISNRYDRGMLEPMAALLRLSERHTWRMLAAPRSTGDLCVALCPEGRRCSPPGR